MKRLSLVFVFCIGLLGYVSNVPASQGAAPAKASALIAQTAKVGLGQHLVTYLGKLVQSTSSFISKQPTVVKLGAAALAASGLGKLLARGVHWYRTGELGISGEVELSDTFQDALSEWIDLYETYHSKIEQTKKTIRFMVPALLGWNKFRTLRANRVVQSRAAEDAVVTAAGYFGLLAGFGDFVVEKCAQLVSSIPSPSFLRTSLQAARLNATRALNNVKHLMRTEGITQDDIRKYEEEKHLRLSPELKAQLYDYAQNSSSKSKDTPKEVVRWAGDVPEDIEALIDRINHPERYGNQIPRGVLMLGDPGLGKTHAADYIAQETGCPFDSIKAADLMSKSPYIGHFAQSVASLYRKSAEKAKKAGRPAIIFIDEADIILAARQQSADRSGYGYDGVTKEIETTLFPLMDGGSGQTVKNVITIFATNMPQESLDAAFTTRTGRITDIIRMEYPDVDTCLAMLQDAVKKYGNCTVALEHDATLQEFARLASESRFTPDHLYGVIKACVNTAVARAGKDAERTFLANNPQLDKKDAGVRKLIREERGKAQQNAVVTLDILQEEFNKIKMRLDMQKQGGVMPQAIPQHPIHRMPEVAPSRRAAAQPALVARRREEQQHRDRISMAIAQLKERIGWLETCLTEIPKRIQEQASVAAGQLQRARSSSLSLAAGLRPGSLAVCAVRQELQPEGSSVGSRARRGSITGLVEVGALSDIADLDSAKTSVRRMSEQLAQLPRLQDLTAAQAPSETVAVTPVAMTAMS